MNRRGWLKSLAGLLGLAVAPKVMTKPAEVHDSILLRGRDYEVVRGIAIDKMQLLLNKGVMTVNDCRAF